MAALVKNEKFKGVEGPLLTIVMDGVGLAPEGPGNAVRLAKTPVLDMLMEKYPDRIQNKYSQTKKRTYPMNVCEHCGNGQGWYYIYKDVNEKIQEMKEIDVFTE